MFLFLASASKPVVSGRFRNNEYSTWLDANGTPRSCRRS